MDLPASGHLFIKYLLASLSTFTIFFFAGSFFCAWPWKRNPETISSNINFFIQQFIFSLASFLSHEAFMTGLSDKYIVAYTCTLSYSKYFFNFPGFISLRAFITNSAFSFAPSILVWV